FVSGIQMSLHERRIARHSKAEYPEYEACENETRTWCDRCDPVRVRKVQLYDTEQVEHADDRDQRGILEKPDERVDDAWNDQLESLRHDDQPDFLPVA